MTETQSTWGKDGHYIEYTKGEFYKLCAAIFNLSSSVGGYTKLSPLNTLEESQTSINDLGSLRSTGALKF